MRASSPRSIAAVAAATALTLALGSPALAAGSFTDDDGSVHESAIEAIVLEGITLGCGELVYCPSDVVTRGQMASFIARGFDLPEPDTDHFTDDDGTTHEDNINRLADAGMTTGFPDGTYRPDDTVTREQVASLLARALDLEPVDGDTFTDVSGVHAQNIYAVAAAGITQGCNTDGTQFCPIDDVRRDQMASFLARSLDLELLPVPDETYDTELERCVVDGVIEAANALGGGMVGLEYAPQAAIARADAAAMAALGVDWVDDVPEPQFLTDELLALHGITDGFAVFEGNTNALNADCATVIEHKAPGEGTSPGLYYVAAGVVIDPATDWRYIAVYSILIVEF